MQFSIEGDIVIADECYHFLMSTLKQNSKAAVNHWTMLWSQVGCDVFFTSNPQWIFSFVVIMDEQNVELLITHTHTYIYTQVFTHYLHFIYCLLWRSPAHSSISSSSSEAC